MGFEYKEKYTVNITEHLNKQKNYLIKQILDLLDMSDINENQKKKIRQVVLDGMNDYHNLVYKIFSFIQENDNIDIK